MTRTDKDDAASTPLKDFQAACQAMRDLPPSPPPAILIHRSPFLLAEREQFRFPRSKRCRIRKKWRKDPRNWRTVGNIVRGLDGSLVVDPETFEAMKDEFLPRVGAQFEVRPTSLAEVVSAGLDIKTPKIAEQAFPPLP